MAEIILKTETRTTFGKQNKSLRKNGIIPINMYGLGDSISLQVNEDILYKTLKEVGYTTPLKISISGKDETYTLVRNISIHPVTDKVIHVDFLRVNLDKPIEAQVPILLINQEEAPGTRGGAGVVTQGVYEVTVLAKPLEIPSELTVDCSVLEEHFVVAAAAIGRIHRMSAAICRVIRLEQHQKTMKTLSDSLRAAPTKHEVATFFLWCGYRELLKKQF